MKLSVIAVPSRHGLGQSTVWDWWKTTILPAGTELEILPPEQAATLTGDRVLLMGQRPVELFIGRNLPIDLHRGELHKVFGRPATMTFDIQAAYDFRPEASDKSTDLYGKDGATTRKQNWLFWVGADTKKILLKPPVPEKESQFSFFPKLRPHIEKLATLRNATIFLDIETDRTSDTLACVGFAVNESPVFVVPVYTYDGKLAYPKADILRFLAALATALTHNTVVIHNAMFDLLYLASKYRMPFGRRIFDTMICHHRMHAEVEKSLGHVISYWTWHPYHKGELHSALSGRNQQAFWEYNAKDVGRMRDVWRAQTAYINEHPDLLASVTQANASIYPYLLASLRGVRVDISRLLEAKTETIGRLHQIRRIACRLTGIPAFNPNSTKQLLDFFHKKLNYPVVGRTSTGAPSLDEKALYQLLQAHDNPLIPTILKYRELDKERTQMEFINWVFPWNEPKELLATL